MVELHLIHSICYLSIPEEDRLSWRENPMEHSDGHEHIWGCFDENGKLYSSLAAIPIITQFNNKPMKAIAYQGAVTLPEARNKGYIREIFKAIFADMKENEQLFSYGYPFSYSYYRKFGLEHIYTRYEYEFPLYQLSTYTYPNALKEYSKDTCFEDFKKIYDVFIKDKNLAIIRSDEDWKNLMNRDPYLRREFTYINYNDNGNPDAYILYKPEKKGEDFDFALSIQELAWSAPEGLHAILGFLYGLRSEYNAVRWEVPDCIDIYTLLPDSWDISKRMKSGCMNRIPDLPKVLDRLIAPPDIPNGSVVVDVTDKFLSYNSGRYLISWETGEINVSKTDKNPDFVTDIETFTQIITGFITPSQASIKRGIQIISNEEKLDKLFPKRHLYMIEHW